MSKIVQFFFELTLQVKLYHWQTKVYARHKASDKLFQKILDGSDRFMEVYIGKYGRTNIKIHDKGVKVGNLSDKQMADYLKKSTEFLSKDLHTLNLINKETDTDLLTLRDELLVEINTAIYLFTFE